jgi:hypothetical protein
LGKVFKSKTISEPEVTKEQEDNESLLEEQKDLDKEEALDNSNTMEHSSVYHISEILGGKNQVEFLEKEVKEMVFFQRVVKNVENIVKARNPDKLLEFFKNMALYTKEHNITFTDMKSFVENESALQSALTYFKQTLKDHSLSKEDYEVLKCYPPFTTLLETKEIIVSEPQTPSNEPEPVLNEVAPSWQLDEPK